MPTRIRLQRKGRKKRPFYHIVVADQRSPRDGKYIERLGSFNPMTEPATVDLDADKAFEWLMKGAQPSETARAILKGQGVLYKKHLQRGVSKGAMTQEQADEKLEEFLSGKSEALAAKAADSAKAREERNIAISGEAKPLPDPDDLTKIEGIGPKIAEAIQAAGVVSFADLAEAGAEKVKEILDAAEGNFAAHDPATWSEQAQMAADGEWDKLKTWQDELDGGKVVEAAAEEPAAEEAAAEEPAAEESKEESAE